MGVKLINDLGGEELGVEGLRFYDEVMTLTSAIEEAIIRGQRSLAVYGDIRESAVASNEDLAVGCVNAGPGVVGQADDF